MTPYDPDFDPDAATWLRTDESERVRLVEAAHRTLSLGDARRDKLHALSHIVVENQLASGAPPIATETLTRLTEAGVPRHDAVHAIGSVMSKAMFEVMQGKAFDLERYATDLGKLKVRDWMPRRPGAR